MSDPSNERPPVDPEEERPTKKQRVEGESPSSKKEPGTKRKGDGVARNNPNEGKIKALRGITQAMSRKDPDGCATALKAAIEGGFQIPPSSLAGVLHQYDSVGRYKDGVNVFETIIEPYLVASSQKQGGDAVPAPATEVELDEKVSTMLLRLQCHLVDDLSTLKSRVERIAQSLHRAGTLKRRLFSEPLKQFAIKAAGGRTTPVPEGEAVEDAAPTPVLAAAQASLSLLEAANKYELELWDEDFLHVATAVEEDYLRWRKEGNQRSEAWVGMMRQLEVELLQNALVRYHPITGSLLATKLCTVFGAFKTLSQQTQVGTAGTPVTLDQRVAKTCPSCDVPMQKFAFEEKDRLTLMRDIDERLVIPSIYRYKTTGSHRIGKAQKNKDQADYQTAMAALNDADMTSYNLFKENIKKACTMPLPEGFVDVAIIDGANVGYYGVSGWYTTAKKEVLESRGVDLAKVPKRELEHYTRKGQAMDVPLNFAAINAAAVAATQKNWLPIIVLHERHLNGTMTPSNKSTFDSWALQSTSRQRPMVVASPASMNDDFAWLFASVENKCKVITNDLMRDHHYGTLGRRTFLRWREQYSVPFRGKWPNVVGTFPLNAMSIWLANPPLFATWIQPSTSSSAARWDWHIPFYPDVQVLDQSTNDVKTEEELDAAASEQETVKWLCTR